MEVKLEQMKVAPTSDFDDSLKNRSTTGASGGNLGTEHPKVDLEPEIIGCNSGLRDVLDQVEIVAPTSATVLIQGETGTGKELIAMAVHKRSSRQAQKFIKINCAAIPATLLESELFGHEKGAFTGAIARKVGRFELADGGTLFLDEVAEIPLEVQPKLLRVLQQKEFERLGGTQLCRVDVRLVAATGRDLSQMVAQGHFRSDLYFRLNVFPIRIPPLRERKADIPLLVRYFVSKYARQMQKRIDTIPAKAMDFLTSYGWPGNIRELQNFIERSVIMSRTPILDPPLADLKESKPGPVPTASAPGPKAATLAECERQHILRALTESRWIIGGPNGAAVSLGVKRTTLIGKMQKLGINRTPEVPASPQAMS